MKCRSFLMRYLSVPLLVGTMFASMSYADDDQINTRVDELIAKINAGENSPPGQPGYEAQLLQLGNEAVPRLIRHARDENPRVRLAVIDTLANIRDARAVPVLFHALDDPDPNRNVANYALGGLVAYADVMPDAVKQVYYLEQGRSRLSHRIANRASIFLAGAMEDKDMIPLIRSALNAQRSSTRESAVSSDTPYVNRRTREITWDAPGRIQEAALKVLLKLGEEEAVQEVRMALSNDASSSRTIAIGCLDYAKRKDFAPDLLPLLDDSRDGAIIGTIRSGPGARPRIRVQDLAAPTLADLLAIDRSEYKLNDNPRHEQMELDKLRMLAINALMTTKYP